MRRIIIIIVSIAFMAGFTQQAEAGKKMFNGLLGFLAGTASTYLILKGINPKIEWRDGYKTEGQMKVYATGVGVLVGTIAYVATKDNASNFSKPILSLSKGKRTLSFPSLKIVGKHSNNQLRLTIISLTH